MKLEIDAVNQYGQVRYYVHDDDVAQTVGLLTGTLTLSQAQVLALTQLGLQVDIIEKIRKPR